MRGQELFGSTFVLLHSLPKKHQITHNSSGYNDVRKCPGHVSSNQKEYIRIEICIVRVLIILYNKDSIC